MYTAMRKYLVNFYLDTAMPEHGVRGGDKYFLLVIDTVNELKEEGKTHKSFYIHESCKDSLADLLRHCNEYISRDGGEVIRELMLRYPDKAKIKFKKIVKYELEVL